MFSKPIVAGLLALALSVQAVPARQQNNAQCSTLSTVIKTVTVTARGTTPTVNQANNNKGNKATTTAASAKNTNNAANNNTGNKNNTGNNGGKTNTGTNNGGKTNTNANNNGNPQTSLTLDPRVIASGFANNGQDVPTAGQVASLTSTNNFINFCLTVPNLPITNGKQITTGSCNPAPIGVIPSVDNMPSSKFTFPANFGTLKANTPFTIKMAIQKMQTGFFTNAQQTYFAAPQQLNGAGQIQGHSHVVIEALTALDQTTPTDPKKFVFFKGLNAAASGGILTADVTNGLAAGVYKLSSINTAANHQPVIVPVAQHGSLDDAIYFTVTADGQPANTGNAGGQKTSNTGGQNNGNTGGQNNGKTGGQNAGNNGGQNNGKTGGQNTGNNGGQKAATTAATTAATAKAGTASSSTNNKGNGNLSKNGSRIVNSGAKSSSAANAKTTSRFKRTVNRMA